jgi:MoaA/NifB/PqqE/SkfB family radical SAM enzyme
MNSKPSLSPVDLFRLPWNLADNAISWLEPTSACNLACDGCYRDNRHGSHKPLEVIDHELDVFARNRRCDGVSIAGGEPLLHPHIPDIVRLVKKRGWKAIINTNGGPLTRELLIDLKKAGVDAFTFHVDSRQGRPHWTGKSELELCELRSEYAEMLASAGGIGCSFNATVYPETIESVPGVIDWAQQNMRIVHGLVFILYRMAILGRDLDFYAGKEQVHFEEVNYSKMEDDRRVTMTSNELVDIIRRKTPDFMPCAFLNGTEDVDSFKWLLTGRLGNKHRIFGYPGPRFMELVQNAHHFWTGRYLAYSHPAQNRRGRLYFLLAPFDKGLRRAARSYLASLATSPAAFFSRVRFQSVMIIQPADLHPDGAINMCDGCPDITVWNDRLVWSCRMEEQMKWGMNVRGVPRQ